MDKPELLPLTMLDKQQLEIELQLYLAILDSRIEGINKHLDEATEMLRDINKTL